MTNNKFIRNYYPLLIVAIGFIFILIMGFFVFRFGMERGLSEKESLSYSALCSKFSKTEGEISCEDAVNLVSKKYTGKITSIVLTNGKQLNLDPSLHSRNYWKVELTLSGSITLQDDVITGDIEVVVDKTTGRVILYKFVGV